MNTLKAVFVGAFLAMLAFGMAGCGLLRSQPDRALTMDERMGVACKDFESTANAIVPFAHKLNGGQVIIVRTAISVVRPACNAWADGTALASEDAITAVRDHFRSMILVKSAVVPNTGA